MGAVPQAPQQKPEWSGTAGTETGIVLFFDFSLLKAGLPHLVFFLHLSPPHRPRRRREPEGEKLFGHMLPPEGEGSVYCGTEKRSRRLFHRRRLLLLARRTRLFRLLHLFLYRSGSGLYHRRLRLRFLGVLRLFLSTTFLGW